MPGDPFYVSKAWIALRNKVRRKWKAQQLPCGLCGKPFVPGDKTIVDHIVERRTRPDLSLVESNLHLTHHQCNSIKAKAEKKPWVNEQGYPPGWA